MGTPGDDLRQYLIIPSSQPISSSLSVSSPASTHSGKRPFFISTSRTETESNRVEAHTRSNDKAEASIMEIDMPIRPQISSSAHAEQDAMTKAAPPMGILSMDDFLKQHQDEHQAQREAMIAAPPAKKAKAGGSVLPPTPVAVGARSSKYTIMLHEKYQALGIPQPVFTYEGGTSGWVASVSFPGLDNAEELQGLGESKRFNSKQEAKEALSQKAFAVLEELEKQGRVKKTAKAQKKGDDGSQGERPQPEENYVGKLLEFQRSISGPQPTYTDYQSGTRFACLLTLDDHPEPFGSLTSLFSSKKAARQDAARHAVEHFQALNLWPEDAAGGIKKKKKAVAPSPPVMQDLHDKDPFSLSSLPTPVSNTNNTSFAQQVASLAATLSLSTPEWRFTPHPSDPSFHSVACFFRDGGAHAGPLGEVRNVYGKKKAKEECARLTLDYLLDVRAKRRAYGARMMLGVTGGEDVVPGVEGRRVESEEQDEESGDEKVAFEDAVEEMV